jgi:formylglycine-generating enzyme required for sulfatase activity
MMRASILRESQAVLDAPFGGRLGGLLCALLWSGVGLVLSGCEGKPPHTQTPTDCFAEILEKEVLIDVGPQFIGSNSAYAEERPLRQIAVAPFFMDVTEVTNAQFARFVSETGYITVAEIPPDPSLLPPNAPEEMKQAGAAVFSSPSPTSPNGWRFQPGATWRQPSGPGSTIVGRDHHPVVQVAFADAQAYAAWAGRRLPTEAEWEVAARGGLDRMTYEWGNDAPSESDHPRANTWQGFFPIRDEAQDGYSGTAPVGCFRANGFGLYDMTGNVWEWTDTPYQNAKSNAGEAILTLKGGSWLCADNYCRRYRPSARQGQEVGLPTNHIGFRTVKSATE